METELTLDTLPILLFAIDIIVFIIIGIICIISHKRYKKREFVRDIYIMTNNTEVHQMACIVLRQMSYNKYDKELYNHLLELYQKELLND